MTDASVLGYKPGMRSEILVAERWRGPLTSYMNTLHVARRAEATIYQRGYALRKLAQAHRDRDPQDLTLEDLVVYLSGRDWSPGTMRAQRGTIVAFYGWMHGTGRMPTNPALLLPTVQAPKGRPRPAPSESVREAIANAPERVRLMIYLGAFHGLRRAEIAAVNVRDIGRDAEGYVLNVNGKGSKVRTIPIEDRFAVLLQHAASKCPWGWVFPSYHKGDERFPNGEHLSAHRVGVLISQTLPEGVTAHMLRHRYASDLYIATGRDIRAVQDALGHASLATTQVYTEVPKSAIRAGMRAMTG